MKFMILEHGCFCYMFYLLLHYNNVLLYATTVIEHTRGMNTLYCDGLVGLNSKLCVIAKTCSVHLRYLI